LEDKVVYIYKNSGKYNIHTSTKFYESRKLASCTDMYDYIVNCSNGELQFHPWGKTIMLLEGIYSLKNNGCSFQYVKA